MNTNQRYTVSPMEQAMLQIKTNSSAPILGRPPPNIRGCARSGHALLARPGSKYPAVDDSCAGGLTVRAGGADDSDRARGDRRADHGQRVADWLRCSTVWAADRVTSIALRTQWRRSERKIIIPLRSCLRANPQVGLLYRALRRSKIVGTPAAMRRSSGSTCASAWCGWCESEPPVTSRPWRSARSR